MHDKRVITLHILDEDDFDERYGRIAVPELVVDSTIDLLAGILVQWKAEVGSQPDERVWAALMTAVGHALGGLIAARAARFYETGGRVVVEQIDEYLNWSGVREDL